MKAPQPPHEKQRLAVLRECNILDTRAEDSFDDLVLLASEICGAPISLMTMVDEDRQWFKATVGLSIKETSRDVAFCAHAILQRELLVVPDAIADERFSDNPLVVGEPRIRFYAGAPLITDDGFPLGTLCVIDHVPRELSEFQAKALTTLARAVVSQLDLRRAITKGKRFVASLSATLPELCEACREKVVSLAQ